MSGYAHLPAITGLAIGIAFIILLSFVLAAGAEKTKPVFTLGGHVGFRPDKYEHISISIDGLKERYSIGEPIAFSAHITGYTSICDTAPKFKIVQSNSDKIVYSYNPFVIGMCDIKDFVDNTETFDEAKNDVIINETGQYRLFVQQFGEIGEKDFVVSRADSGISVSPEQLS
jgi:hypothetical protein